MSPFAGPVALSAAPWDPARAAGSGGITTPNHSRISSSRLTLMSSQLTALDDGAVASTELTPVYAALAASKAVQVSSGQETTNPGPISKGRGSNNNKMVELAGLEPATSWVRSRRSPN
jgi:hypothetical protein